MKLQEIEQIRRKCEEQRIANQKISLNLNKSVINCIESTIKPKLIKTGLLYIFQADFNPKVCLFVCFNTERQISQLKTWIHGNCE